MMIKTQVQIPDELFERAKRVAAQNEWPFAETVCRGLEYITTVRPPREEKRWELPPSRDCGAFLVPEDQWTEAARR